MPSFADIDRQLADVPPRVAELLAAVEAAHERALRAEAPAPPEAPAAGERPEVALAFGAAGGGPLSVRTLLQVHRALLGPDADSVPVDAQAGLGLTELVARYELAVSRRQAPRLLLLCALTLDFLTIQPFREGNERSARLLVVRELLRHGYEARHASIEQAVRETAEEGERALRASQVSWPDSQHDPWPWAAYLLGVVASAYAQLERPAASAPVAPTPPA